MVSHETNENLLGLEEAIEYLQISRPTLYRWLKDGSIQGYRAGRQWRFRRADLDRFVRRETTALEQDLQQAITFFKIRIRSRSVFDQRLGT